MKILLLLIPLFSSNLSFTPLFPSSPLSDVESLHRLIDIVKTNHLNLSIVISKQETNADVALDVSVSLTIPLNHQTRTRPTLDQPACQKFLEFAAGEKLGARSLFCKDNDHFKMENTGGMPNSHAHRVSTVLDDGKKNVWSDKNYISRYSFVVGGNVTKTVLFGDFDIEVKRAANFTAEEVTTSKKLLLRAFLEYTPNDFSRALVAMFGQEFGQRWQLVVDFNEKGYIKPKKIIELKLLNKRYMIYSV